MFESDITQDDKSNLVLNLQDAESFSEPTVQQICGNGKTLIVAPHADDESLGCGGLIKLLTEQNQAVSIVLLTDGTLSHPNSKRFPAEKLRDLREKELLEAAEILGVAEKDVYFLRYRDRSLPGISSQNFADAVQSCRDLLDKLFVETVFVPWRRDPHPDHRAAYQIFAEARKTEKLFEYAIWLKELGESEDFPQAHEVFPFRVNIGAVLEAKKRAINAHRSQISDLIDDDPHGFRLSSEMLARFDEPYEIFLQGVVR